MDGNSSSHSLCDITFSNEEASQFLYPRALQVCITVVIPLVTVIGLICNGIFMYVAAKIPAMRTVTNLYLTNLAVSDSIILLCGSIQYLYSYYNSPVNLSFAFETGFGCAIASIIGYCCYFNSVFIVTLVMFDRYMAICHPFYHRKIAGKGRAFKLIATSWILALLLSTFAADGSTTNSVCLKWDDNASDKYPSQVYICAGRTNWAVLILYMVDFIQFFFSCCVCTFFIASIILTLSSRVPSTSASDDKRITTERKQISRMLITNAIIFFLCLGPFQALNFEFAYVYFAQSDLFAKADVPFILAWVGQATTLLNASINPIVYSVTNERYRRALKEAFLSSNKMSHSQQSIRSTTTL